MGLGAILGSVFMASLKKGTNLKIILLISSVILGVGMVLFSRISYFPVAMVFAVVIGFGSLTPMTSSITIIQIEAAPHMRGRVMSYIAMAYFGMLPFGSLIIGTISEKISAPLTMLCQGVMALVIAIIFSKYLTKTSHGNNEHQKPVNSQPKEI
jgi:MFS family permease